MSLSDLARDNRLRRVGARPSLLSYIKQTWERRDFILTMARYRLAVQNQENRFGAFWLVLKPTLNAIVYGLIFGVIQGGNRPADYPAYVVVGVFIYELFASSFTDGAKAITGNRPLVQSLSFPRIALPLAHVAEGFYTLLLSTVVMFAILIVLGHPPTLRWFLLLPLYVLYTMFNTGVALITARLTVHFRDLAQFLPFISRLIFYTSGTLFDVTKIFKEHPWVIQIYDWHPIYQTLVIARSALMTNASYDPSFWLHLSWWAVATLGFGFVFFWVAEERYGRD